MPQIQRGEAPKFSLPLYLICEPLDLAAASWLVTCGGQECLSLLSRSLTGMLNKQGLMSVPAVPHQTPPQTGSLPTCCYLVFNFPGSRRSAWPHLSRQSPGVVWDRRLPRCCTPTPVAGRAFSGSWRSSPASRGHCVMCPWLQSNKTLHVHPALWSPSCRHVGPTLEILALLGSHWEVVSLLGVGEIWSWLCRCPNQQLKPVVVLCILLLV